MGGELTDGQQRQLDKNRERISTLERDVHSLKERIEDGMHQSIYGKARKQLSHAECDQDDDEVDDFYDRTATSSNSLSNEIESEESLIKKWERLLKDHATQQAVISRAAKQCAAIQQQI